MSVSDQIFFALQGSLVDLVNRSRIGLWSCPSARYLESDAAGGVTLKPIVSDLPAISKDGAIYLEPANNNLVTHNLDLSQSIWQKGTNVVVSSDSVAAPDAGFLGDKITFVGSNLGGATQILRYSLAVSSGSEHQAFWILQLAPGSGKFGAKDVIRITDSNFSNIISLNLSQLNDTPGKWSIIPTSFQSPGTSPVLPEMTLDDVITVSALSGVTATLTGDVLSNTALNQLTGAKVVFSSDPEVHYVVLSNTAYSSGSISITLDAASLPGVSVDDEVALSPPDKEVVYLELYCENTVTLNWGGVYVGEGSVRPSMIYQGADRINRAASLLSYQPKDNPIVGLSSFGVFVDLKAWRGDGNIADFGDFKIKIEGKKLVVSAGNTIAATTNDLTESAKLFTQINPESSSLSVYVNGVLANKVSIAGFTPTLKPLSLTSDGVRSINCMYVVAPAIADGSAEIGQNASDDIAEIFVNNPIPSSMIAGHDPGFALAQLTVAGTSEPTINSTITAINTGTSTITVASGTGFTSNSSIQIFRGADRIGYRNAGTVSGANIPLDSVAGLKIGDTVISGELPSLSRVFARFPFVPIVNQRILAIDTGTKRVQVSAALGFTKSRAFVRTSLYQDVSEAIVTNVDSVDNWITLTSVSNMSVGNYISQPYSELTISPANYLVRFLEGETGLLVDTKAANGVVLVNPSKMSKTVTPFIEVAL